MAASSRCVRLRLHCCAFQCVSACVTVTPKSTLQKSIAPAPALKAPHATDIKLNIGMGLMHLGTVPGTREGKRVSESRDYKRHTEYSGSSIPLFFSFFLFFLLSFPSIIPSNCAKLNSALPENVQFRFSGFNAQLLDV